MGAILIIEDDDASAQLMRTVLEVFKYPILIAENAQIGLDLIQENEISLVLIDMRLPGMTGWELTPILRTKLQLSDIPIIAVSVQVERTEAQRALDVGCDEFIAKPFNIIDFRQRVADYLNR